MAADVFQNREDGRVAIPFQTLLCVSLSPLLYVLLCNYSDFRALFYHGINLLSDSPDSKFV